jgi:hypothetical protein
VDIHIIAPRLRRREKEAGVAHKLYCFAGRGFRSPANKEHWKLCRTLLEVATIRDQPRELPFGIQKYGFRNCSSSIEPPPKLCTTIECRKLLDETYGDSSGGNIALVLGICAASEYLGAGQGYSGQRLSSGKCSCHISRHRSQK